MACEVASTCETANTATANKLASSHVWLSIVSGRVPDCRSIELLNKGGPPRLPTRLGCDCQPRRRRRHTAALAHLGLDKMLAARRLARFVASSARLGSARLNFFAS
jgi:hypothetical protein